MSTGDRAGNLAGLQGLPMTDGSHFSLVTASLFPPTYDEEIALIRAAVFLGTKVRHVSASAVEALTRSPTGDDYFSSREGKELAMVSSETPFSFQVPPEFLERATGDESVDKFVAAIQERHESFEKGFAFVFRQLNPRVGLAWWDHLLSRLTYAHAHGTGRPAPPLLSSHPNGLEAQVVNIFTSREISGQLMSDVTSLAPAASRDFAGERRLHEELIAGQNLGVLSVAGLSGLEGSLGLLRGYVAALQDSESNIHITDATFPTVLTRAIQQLDQLERNEILGTAASTLRQQLSLGGSAVSELERWSAEGSRQAEFAFEVGRLYTHYRTPAILSMPITRLVDLRAQLERPLIRLRRHLLEVAAEAPLDADPGDERISSFFRRARVALDREWIHLQEHVERATVKGSWHQTFESLPKEVLTIGVPEAFLALASVLRTVVSGYLRSRREVTHHPLYALYKIDQ